MDAKSSAGPVRATFDDLRIDLLRSFVFLLAAVAGAILAVQLVDGDLRRPASGLIMVALVGSGMLAWYLAPRWTWLGVAALIGGSIVALVVGLLVYPGTPLVDAFALIAVVATVLAGLVGGGVTAILISAAIIALHNAAGSVFPADDVTPIICLVWLGVVVAWLGTRATQTAIDWSWHSYEETLRKMQEARERQVELGRVSKSLAEAFVRLEQLNRELDHARQAADEARRLKTEFATTISHELRTPLNLIIGFAEMMVTAPQSYVGETLPASYRGDVEAIYRNAGHLSNLLDDVLDLSQVDAHRLALQKEDISLARVVQEATATVAALYRDVGLSLTIDLPDDLPLLHADPTRVRQILINLLTNAVRFTDRGGVTVQATHDEHDVIITVADTGCGIPPDDLPMLFHEFAQGTTPRRRMGSGLGLAVSKRFAELHGGTMWVDSVPGQGTTFYVSLPLVKNVVPGVADRDWHAYVGPGRAPDERLAVVVGPDPAVAALFRRYLDGCRVIGTATLGRARRLVARGGVDAVILADGSVGERQGVSSAAGSLGGVPVIACSLNTPWTRRDELGVAAYLPKPVARQRLRAAIRSLGARVGTILIVEDDPDLANLLDRMVASLVPGSRVRRAADGEEALSLVCAERPDLILLDLLLPRVDGYTVLRELRAGADRPAVPVIVITGQEQGNQAVMADGISLTRAGGLTAGEVMHVVKGVLSLPAQLAPARRAASSESPVSEESRRRRAKEQGSAREEPSK